MHQAKARTTLLVPIGVPSNSPRSVSMTGVKGWYSANQGIPTGIESGRTNALLVNGSSSWKMRERLLAPAGVLPTRPIRCLCAGLLHTERHKALHEKRLTPEFQPPPHGPFSQSTPQPPAARDPHSRAPAPPLRAHTPRRHSPH